MIKMRAWIWLSVALVMINSCQQDKTGQSSSAKDTTTIATDTATAKRKNIVFFGNSITAGYGLDLTEAFPARIQDKLDSMGLPYTVVNAGVSGETSSGGNSRIDWILKQPVDIFVLELGGNDGLRGIPVSETKKNLQSIIDKVKAKNPQVKIVIAGMQIPPNMGKRYTSEFKTMYPNLAKKNNTALVPFILEGVGGVANLNLDDGIHPTPEGHRILAQNVWSVLQPML
jgi:acyl-CoA thioesterase I